MSENVTEKDNTRGYDELRLDVLSRCCDRDLINNFENAIRSEAVQAERERCVIAAIDWVKCNQGPDGYLIGFPESLKNTILRDNKELVDIKLPTREQYAKWVAFFITSYDDKEARACGCFRDAIKMLRDLYEREINENKESTNG